MDNEKEKYVVRSQMNQTGGKPLKGILQEDSVGTKHIKNKAVTADKLADSILEGLIDMTVEGAIARISKDIVSNKFGNSTVLAINQKLLTDTINDIYNQLREIKGEPPVGLYLSVSPEYFIGEEGCDIHIKAVSTQGIMERVAFYIDDVKLEGGESEFVYQFEADTHIDDTSIFRCEATIFGIDYSVEKVITHYTSFWLGAGAAYQDIMDTAHTIPIEQTIRGAFNVECGEGEHIIVIVGDTLKKGFIRADLNGFEIPFNVEKITKDGNVYWVYTSENVYHAGTYNIDING